jgi:serine protease Do
MSRRGVSRFSPRGAFTLVAASALFTFGPAFGDEREVPTLLDAIQRQTSAVFKNASGAVVRIEATDDHGRLSGTGFFVDPNGTIFTCYSVGGETRELTVTFGGNVYPATRLISDLRSGVAILKIEAQTPFLAIGKSRELNLASPAMIIGFPMDMAATPAFGLVAGFDIKYQGRLLATTHIRVNIPVQRGQGGAPLLDLRGEVVGILVAALDGGSSAFALPIEAAEKIRRDYLRFQKVRRGWLGVQIGPIDDPVEGSTAEVTDVLPESPGLKAGVRPGDVLLGVGARNITSPEDVLDASFYLTADDEITLRISRSDQELELKVQPIDAPEVTVPLPRLAPAFPPDSGLRLQLPGQSR